MKFDVDDKNRRRLVCVKFHLNRCRFAVAVAKSLGAHFFGTQCSLLVIQREQCTCTQQLHRFLQIHILQNDAAE